MSRCSLPPNDTTAIQRHFARQETLDISGQGTDYSFATKATESVGDSESEGSDLDFISDDGTSEVGSARGDLVEKSCSLEDGFVSGSGSEYDDLNFGTSQEDEENVTSQRLWGVDITAFLLRHLKEQSRKWHVPGSNKGRLKGQMNQNFDLFYFSSILVKCV